MVTLAANVTTLPLVVYYFGRLSIVSLLTNVLILPAQPPIMLAGSAGVVAGIAGLELVGQWILALPWLCLAWTVRVVQWTAALPGASLEIAGYGLGAMLATYAAIVIVKEQSRLQRWLDRLRTWAAPDWWGRLINPAAASGLALTTVLAWTAVASLPDGRLHLWFLDVGQGDGILIQTPSGRQVLIDGGASPEALFSELGAVMPFWDRTLDLLVLTHPDGDHMLAQAELPARYQIDQAIHTAHAAQHPDEALWRERMAAGGVTVTTQAAGGWLDLGDGVALWVLWPAADGFTGEDADNENSLVTRLVYGDFSALLTGDAGLASERLLVSQGAPLASTLLKAGHHGSRSSSSPAFIARVAPQIAVIQVGAENDYGHPHAEVLDELAGRTVLRNDLDGRIHVWSDGRVLWSETEQE
jgi:competence protein ComEC